MRDALYALRLMRRTPATSLLIITVLALGMGATTAVFSVLNNTLLRPMLLHDVEELVRIDDVSRGPEGFGTETNISPVNVALLGSSTSTLSSITAQNARWFVVTDGDEPERVRGAGVSAGWHETLGVQPALGRGFTEEELAQGFASTSVIIGHDLWTRRFGRSPDVLNRTIEIDDRALQVVGVMPRGFRFPYEAEVWTPIEYEAGSPMRYLLVFARRRDNAQLEQVQAELQSLSAQLTGANPSTHTDWQMRAQPLRDNLVRGADRTAFALLVTVAFLLVIACVNVAALILARVTGRRDEMLVRGALGASRAQLVRMVVVEAFTFTALGAAAGVLLANLFAPLLGALVPPVMSVELAQNEITLDARVFAFAALLTLCAVIVAGLVPAMRALPRDLQGALRQGARAGGSPVRSWTVRGLIIGEVTFALLLLVGAAGVVLGFTRTFGGSPGYDAADVLTMRVTLPAEYDDPARRIDVVERMLAETSSLSNVTGVTATTTNPRLESWSAAFTTDDAASDAEPAETQLVVVTPGYFETMRTRVEGRAFNAADRASSAPVAIISRNTAQRLWPGQDPVGRRLRFPGAPAGSGPTVIGIAEETRWATEPAAAVFLPYAQVPIPQLTGEFHLMVRTTGDPTNFIGAVRSRLADVAPRVPVSGVAALEEVRAPEYLLERTGAVISAGFAVLGTLIAMLGIFGALSYAVEHARREMAVRQALGATPRMLLALQLREMAVLVGAGAVAGTAGGAALNRLLRHLLEDTVVVEARIYLTLIAVVVMLGAIASVAPALRAVRTDPMMALRGG